ncbi:LD-carboxypeptidase [Sphingopyxis sp. MWB1]|uniref:LD-carboxypeptidase n=1 Tax=Sphingopyxis sp. MWB1 TaxID=1537715 RepID=UPI00051A1C25|nr:LD-carboxypeptidase [Sphingopyxis sp. MWB1]
MRIGIVAPSTPILPDDAEAVRAIASIGYPEVELVFDEQCFAVHGHFAGEDGHRFAALVEMANRPDIDAIWFARGGYGACRIAEDAVRAMTDAARGKAFLGYSDQGNLLAALYREGFDHVAHGPMVADIRREGGDAAVTRALDWLVARDPAACEGALAHGARHAAFNLMTLSMLLGTPLEPDLAGHVLIVEEVSEYLYAFDRAFFHVASTLGPRGLAGLRLGRVSDIPENDRPFGMEAEEIARHWCERCAIPWLGRADIGHDAANKVVPFGLHRAE